MKIYKINLTKRLGNWETRKLPEKNSDEWNEAVEDRFKENFSDYAFGEIREWEKSMTEKYPNLYDENFSDQVLFFLQETKPGNYGETVFGKGLLKHLKPIDLNKTRDEVIKLNIDQISDLINMGYISNDPSLAFSIESILPYGYIVTTKAVQELTPEQINEIKNRMISWGIMIQETIVESLIDIDPHLFSALEDPVDFMRELCYGQLFDVYKDEIEDAVPYFEEYEE